MAAGLRKMLVRIALFAILLPMMARASRSGLAAQASDLDLDSSPEGPDPILHEWRLSDTKDICGWIEVECWTLAEPRKVPKSECYEKGLAKESEPMELGHGECPEKLFESVCLASNNDGERQKGPDESTLIAKHCEDADIIVIAIQETSLDSSSAPSGYVPVAYHRHSRGSGISVVSKESSAKYFKYLTPLDFVAEDSSWTNVKGTVILPLHTPKGVFAVASTHGSRSDDDTRFRGFQMAMEKILDLKPAFVFWGGDFNMRTPMGNDENQALFREFTTSSSSLTVDPAKAEEAYQKIAGMPDTYDPHGSMTFSEAIESFSKGSLVEVSVRHLCPTYRKAEGTMMVKAGWMSKKEVFRPRLACKAPNSDVVEYLLSREDGETPWAGKKSRSPSWTDRLVVSKSFSCTTAKKIAITLDHDTVLTKCQFA